MLAGRDGHFLPDRLVLDVESPNYGAAHLRPAARRCDEERYSPLLHGAITLAWLEIPAVILGLFEALVELSRHRLAFNGHQRHVVVMNEIIESQQTITEGILDLELRTPGMRRDAQVIHQRPDDAVAVFNIVQTTRAEQFLNSAV